MRAQEKPLANVLMTMKEYTRFAKIVKKHGKHHSETHLQVVAILEMGK